MARIVTISNVKGGVGKTTTAMNLAIGLATKGKKVLAVDTDPKGNETWALCDQEIGKTIKDLFQGTCVQDVIYPSIEQGLDIIPSRFAFPTVEMEISSCIARETILKRALEPIKNDYDVIVIDTPPSLEVIPINALCATDEVIIPIHEAFAVEALNQMLNALLQIKNRGLNPNLFIRGVLLTMYDPEANLAKEVKEIIKKNFGKVLFNTTIPRDDKLAECPPIKKSIFKHAPESAGAIAYQELTEEIMKTLNQPPNDRNGKYNPTGKSGHISEKIDRNVNISKNDDRLKNYRSAKYSDEEIEEDPMTEEEPIPEVVVCRSVRELKSKDEKLVHSKSVKLSDNENLFLTDIMDMMVTKNAAEAIRWCINKVCEDHGEEIEKIAKKMRRIETL